MTREQAISQLEANGWLAVAADLRDGLPPATVLTRLDRISWEEGEGGHENDAFDEAKAIVSEIHE